MGRIQVLPDQVANKIAAGEVVERPASVVKELLENALDAGATRIRISVEAGGKRLISIVDNGHGMLRDDALLAFERHATSKIKDPADLLTISTLGFRGEALPSIASVSRLRLETRDADEASGSVIEIAGGRILKVEEAGLPAGTSISVRDLFFNVPARKKFLKAESTELSHIAALVTHYSLAHPDKHFELHSATNAMLVAPPVASYSDRIYQIFGKDTLEQLIPLAASSPLDRSGLPQPPPWKRGVVTPGVPARRSPPSGEANGGPESPRAMSPDDDDASSSPSPGDIRIHGFVSKPEVQKLNRNSIFVFVNRRLIRDRLIQHALTDAYRNILPPTVFPVVLLFIELPNTEVDANVHPAKTEVRFRQQSIVHDFVRDAVRDALMKARPVPQFTTEIRANPTASQALSPGALPAGAVEDPLGITAADVGFALQPPSLPPQNARFMFEDGIAVDANAALAVARIDHAKPLEGAAALVREAEPHCAPALDESEPVPPEMALSSLRPLGQIRESFILAVNSDGLWIIDQHVAHERVLFERVLRQRAAQKVETQQLLMPLVVDLTPGQQAVFAEISGELCLNGFDVEPFGSRTIAVKTAPAGVQASEVERMLHELLDQFQREEQATNLEAARTRIAASIACHAAIKVNMPLDQQKMEWLLSALSRTECPMTCPHGRPVVLRYSVKDIQKAFKRI